MAGDGDFVNFASGLPDPTLFPVEELTSAAREILREDATGALQYGPSDGYKPLRAWIAERLRGRGLPATPESVLITSGSEQALDLCAGAFVDPGDRVCIESPTYSAALETFNSFGANYTPIPHDEEGLDVEHADRELLGAKLIYALPNFQNPSGRTLASDRRRRLAAAVSDSGAVLIEDDAYFDLRYDGEDLSPLSSLIPERSLYLSTFSKIIAPGLRVGYVHGPVEIVERLTQLKQIADLHTGSFAQRLVYKYVLTGDLSDHIDRIRAAYRSKRDATLAALHETMPTGVTWTEPEGGMFLWLTLPEGMDSASLLKSAIDRGILFVPGAGFHPDGTGGNTIRLNFASPPYVKIAEGVKELAEIVRSA